MLSPVMRMRDSQTRFFPEPVALDQESKHNKVWLHGPRFDSCIIKEYLYFQPLKYITLVNQSPEQGEEGKVKFFEKLSLKNFF